MNPDFPISVGSIEQFLLAFTRVGSMMLPLGLPSATRAPAMARVAISACFTVALWREWWRPGAAVADPVWAFLSELLVGLLMGLAANAVLEALFFAMHIAGVQSGYQYASTIDPNSQADSPVLPVMGQLLGLSLFFALNGDHYFVRALAASFSRWPPGSAPEVQLTVQGLARGGTLIFETAVRFALPLIALLVTVDLTMGVFTRAHSQLQLISVAFPLKMLLALFTLIALLPVWTRLFAERLGALDSLARSVASIN